MAQVLQGGTNRNLIEKFKQESPDQETPEQVFGTFLFFFFVSWFMMLFGVAEASSDDYYSS